MSVNLSAILNGFQGFTVNGIPNAGGLINTYLAGTTTPAATFTTNSGATPNSNPIQLDASGHPPFEIWLTSGQAYKFVVTDALGLNPYTYDNIVGIGDGSSTVVNAANVNYTAPYTGAVSRTQLSKNTDVVSVKDFGAKGDGTTDDTTAIQAAIGAMQTATGTLLFPPGNYKITSALNVTSKIAMDFSDRFATLMLATQNQNGIVIGDGTSPTRTAIFGTILLNPAFVPFPGVAQSTSGACIFENYVAAVDVVRPSFFGLDGGVRKLFNGLKQFQCQECDSPYIFGQQMHGDVVTATGNSGVLLTIDCNYDNGRFINSDGNGITWGTFCEGLGAYRPECYGLTGWAMVIDPGAGLSNYFVDTPDFEVETASAGGVWFKSGSNLIMRGGWIGANGVPAGLNIGIQADGTSGDFNISSFAVRVLLNGGDNKVSGGEYTGDLTTAGNCITVAGNLCSVAEPTTIRQFVGSAINTTGTPTGVRLAGRFNNNTADITFGSAFTANLAPVIGTCQTDKSRNLTAAATLALGPTVNFAQVTGGVNITTIPVGGVGQRVSIQAGAGGITFAAGGNLGLVAPPLALGAFHTVDFVGDGASWYQSV